MKKFVLLVMTVCCLSTNAQTAIEQPKLFDNVYIGAQFGVTTPLSFDHFLPVNTSFGIKVGKYLTPAFTLSVEGDMWFGSATHDQGRFSYQNAIRATNVGLNAGVDMFNWIGGYDADRVFTIIPEIGIGWLHTFNSNAVDGNDLSAKTGIQFAWNIKQAWQVYAEPVVWWNLTGDPDAKIQFNSNYAQFGLQLGFIYKFKNSNGTHGFEVYDIEAMNQTINDLHEEIADLRLRKQEVLHDTITVTKTVTVTDYANPYYVMFAQNSHELTSEAKQVLDRIPDDVTVEIEATASPEGNVDYNQKLSEDRANAVTEYLTNRGIKVNGTLGKGVTGDASNRIAVISVVSI